MKIFKLMRKTLLVALACQVTLVMQMNTAAHAKIITTHEAIQTYSAHADRASLLAEVRSQKVRDEIAALGIDPAEAEARLAALSDDEIATVLSGLKNEPAGQSALVGGLVTVFIILLVTDLLCFTKIFGFTRCQLR